MDNSGHKDLTEYYDDLQKEKVNVNYRMRVIYMPNSSPRARQDRFTSYGRPLNIPALVGGGGASIVGVTAAFRFKDWLWANKWIILLVLLLIIFVIFMIVKAFMNKEEPPEEE